jgi:hypothetical protein
MAVMRHHDGVASGATDERPALRGEDGEERWMLSAPRRRVPGLPRSSGRLERRRGVHAGVPDLARTDRAMSMPLSPPRMPGNTFAANGGRPGSVDQANGCLLAKFGTQHRVGQRDRGTYGPLASRTALAFSGPKHWNLDFAIKHLYRAFAAESRKPGKAFHDLVRRRRGELGLPVPQEERVLPFRSEPPASQRAIDVSIDCEADQTRQCQARTSGSHADREAHRGT